MSCCSLWSIPEKCEPLILTHIFHTGVVCRHRCPPGPGLPLQRPWVTWLLGARFNSMVNWACADTVSLHLPAGLEELWLGISFVPLEGTLSWEPACPVAAEVSLCQRREDGICVDLPHASQNASREKVRVFDMLRQWWCLSCTVCCVALWDNNTQGYTHTSHAR